MEITQTVNQHTGPRGPFVLHGNAVLRAQGGVMIEEIGFEHGEVGQAGTLNAVSIRLIYDNGRTSANAVEHYQPHPTAAKYPPLRHGHIASSGIG